jgi:hypothetical protein
MAIRSAVTRSQSVASADIRGVSHLAREHATM